MPSAAATIRRVTTPEGVNLDFEVASGGDRVGAFLIDGLILMGLVAACVVALLIVFIASQSAIALSAFLLAWFVLRNFYFVLQELHWGGSTIGKRALRLRVIARDGGPLEPAAIFARNLMREIEFFLPVTALIDPDLVYPDLPGWGQFAGLVWIFLFAFFPLFNKARLRVGDIAAGTMVVRVPRIVLAPDLAGTRGHKKQDIEERRAAQVEEYSFTAQELDHYGIRELQVLEDLLRRREQGEALDAEVLEVVRQKIQKKIDWPRGNPVKTLPFLKAFYKAQRAHLEHKMLFGKRKERKKTAVIEKQKRPR